jgi:hypothetical protein
MCSFGGVPLGLKNGQSAGLELMELTGIVAAFQRQNSCRIYFRASVVTVRGQDDIAWTAVAYDRDLEEAEAQLLALVSVRCGEKRLKTMEAVLLHLLYALDFQLAEGEFDMVEHKRP